MEEEERLLLKEKKFERLLHHAENLLENIQIAEPYESQEERGEASLKKLLEEERKISDKLSAKRIEEVDEILRKLDESDTELMCEALNLARKLGEEHSARLTQKLKRDGKVIVEISEDKLKAYVTIIPPVCNGREVVFNDAIKALREKGVVFGIVEDSIREAIGKAEKSGAPVVRALGAVGIPPVNGRDAKVDFKVELGGRKIKERDDGSVDWHELSSIVSVSEGQLLAVKSPATPGVPGTTVTGEKIPSKPGKDVELKAGANVSVSQDGVEFRAKKDGQVSLSDSTLTVTSLCVIEGDVDYSTGNISFAGNVVIKGRVSDGFVIKSEGNITVFNNIGAANIFAKGDVVVKNGIVGKGKGIIRAEGNVICKFAENAVIEAEGDIIVYNAIIHSDISTNGKVITNTNKGIIIGGVIRAGRGVDAKVIGSEFGISTEVMAGLNFLSQRRLEEVMKKISFYQENLDKIEQIISAILKEGDEQTLSPKQQQILSKTLRSKTMLKDKIEKLNLEKVKLIMEVRDKKIRGQIKASEIIYPGVKITMKYGRMEVKDELRFVSIYEDENEREIRILPYA